MSEAHINADERKTIDNALASIHVRLDNMRGALECTAQAAYHKSPCESDIMRAVECIAESVGFIIDSVMELQDEINQRV